MRGFIKVCTSLVLALVLLGSIGGFQLAAAEEPERGISFRATYPDIVVPIDKEEVELSITVANTGKVVENVRFSVASAPEGWEYQFEAGYPKNIVRAVSLPPKEVDEFKSKQDVTFKAMPPTDAKAGDYRFTLKAITEDEVIVSSLELTIGLSGEVAAPEAEMLELAAEYPLLEGPAGTSFEFKVKVQNKGEEDLTFDLAARLPQRWRVFFSPGWKDERIRALPLKAGSSEDVKLTITPPRDVEAGEYPITFGVSSGEISDTIDLTAIITGTYELALNTIVGEVSGLLNTTATAGKSTPITLLIGNTGSAPLENVSFSSVKPTGWNITFNPEKLDSFAAGAGRAIDVAIEPAGKTIAGDYSITLIASSDQASDSLDFRVTVETPTTWGWVGIAIVIIVIAALVGIFARLRRR